MHRLFHRKDAVTSRARVCGASKRADYSGVAMSFKSCPRVGGIKLCKLSTNC